MRRPADGLTRAHVLKPFAIVPLMVTAAVPVKARGLALLFGWRRVRFTVGVSALIGLLLSRAVDVPTSIVIVRTIVVGLAAMLAFGIFEQWPKRLPRWLARSALQLIAIVLSIPFGAMVSYYLTFDSNAEFTKKDVHDFAALVFAGVLLAPWIAVGAMLRQRDAFAREQALAFELERSRLERGALETKLRLLQAQIEPHFLFNTLANVQALVEAGSPQAAKVLASLIAYLRAAVPRMQDPTTTLAQELDLVRAYLELMQMRMPDRLQFALHIDPQAAHLQCPPVTLLTLVENAVRHGIDPSEQGGRIDVDVWIRDGRCHIRVSDTGVGLKATGGGLGTGLTTLRERLQLAFGGEAELRLSEVQPHGVCAEIEFPARAADS